MKNTLSNQCKDMINLQYVVASNIDLLSVTECFSKIHLAIFLDSMKRVNLWSAKWVQWRKGHTVDSIKFAQLHKELIPFWKFFSHQHDFTVTKVPIKNYRTKKINVE